VAQMPYP